MNKRIHNILIASAIFLVIVIFFAILNIVNANKINYGLKIGNVKIGGITQDSAEQKLESINQELLNSDFYLIYKDSKWKVNLKNLGAETNESEIVKSAFNKGHNKFFLINGWWQIVSLLGYNLNPDWQINENALEEFLRANLPSVHHPAKNASLIYDKNKNDFIITPSESGIIINADKLKKELNKIIKNSNTEDINLYLVNDNPEVKETETDSAHAEAMNILSNAPIKLFVRDDKNKKEIDTVNQDALLSLIDFKAVSDPKNQKNKILGLDLTDQKISDYLILISPMINREPVDARLSVKDGKAIAFSLSQNGVKLNIKENIPILLNGIMNKNKEIILETTQTEPKITTESIDNLGITALLATGTSNFSGSPANRIHNIKIGAAKFNGILIKPDEEFSFNTILGDVGPEQGYLPELVILQNKTTPEYGGGLCQVSTTTFRAAIYAGLKITQRYPHAFPVKYYNPQGFDATIYPPSPDLRFINNTLNYILIQTKIKGTELTFEFYGTDDGRKVEMDGPYQYDINPDGSMKTKFTQKVYDKNNNLIIDKTFYSVYKSPNLYPVQSSNPLE